MRVTLPGRAYLADLERFLRLVTDDGSRDLTFELRDGLFSVHPLVLCMIAAMGETARESGGVVRLENEVTNASSRYLQRMGLFSLLDVEVDISVQEHESAGRFVPLRRIQSNQQLNDFILDVGPLLHASPEETKSVKYVLFELIRNVLEHSGAPGGAYVCAQVAQKSGRLLLGVADAGRGIKSTMQVSHPVRDDKAAVSLAFQPGVTGTTPNFGGNETNGGAGLFFMKSMAILARHHMVVVTGDVLMKLLTDPKRSVHPKLEQDRVKWWTLPVAFSGTSVGIDLTVDDLLGFEELFSDIKAAYGLNVSQSRKARYKARFSR